MSPYPLSGLIKFLLGILLVQGATGALVMAALRTGEPRPWLLFGLLCLALALLAAFWFTTILQHGRKEAVTGLREDFSREREKLRLQAERARAKALQDSHRQILRDRSRTQTKAGFKVGAAFLTTAALGGVVLLSQFVTFGLLALSTAGGALAGYAVRTRQEQLARRREQALPGRPAEKLLTSDSPRRIWGLLTQRRSPDGG
jgi:PHD/YefM family antitoxin component YafN of YafNO toxin-antitoxin module